MNRTICDGCLEVAGVAGVENQRLASASVHQPATKPTGFFTKTFHTAGAIEGAKHLFHDGTIGLTLQNGLGTGEPLLDTFGPERTLVGMTEYSATRTDDGVIHSSDYGNVSLGDYVVGAEPSQSARSIYNLFESADLDEADL